MNAPRPSSRFEDIPGRVFLDSSTLQTLQTYGGYIWEHEPLDLTARIHTVTEGPANLEALHRIFLINERAMFQFALSENSLKEVAERGDAGYLRWAYDVLDHWEVCLEESEPIATSSHLRAIKLDRPEFGYLSVKDRRLLQDAVCFDCDAFLTMEHKLPRSAAHLNASVGLRVLRPVDFWALLEPWAALWC